jgi:hypothetical protein
MFQLLVLNLSFQYTPLFMKLCHHMLPACQGARLMMADEPLSQASDTLTCHAVLLKAGNTIDHCDHRAHTCQNMLLQERGYFL